MRNLNASFDMMFLTKQLEPYHSWMRQLHFSFTVFMIALTHFHRPTCHFSSVLFSPPLSTASLLSVVLQLLIPEHIILKSLFLPASFFAFAFKSENVLKCNFLDILIVIRGKKGHSAAKHCDNERNFLHPTFFIMFTYLFTSYKSCMFCSHSSCFHVSSTFIICQSSFDCDTVNMKK